MDRSTFTIILKKTGLAALNDDISLLSAGVAFYLFFALFPSGIAFIFIAGYLTDFSTISEQLNTYLYLLPTEAQELVKESVLDVALARKATMGWGAAVSLTIALYSSSSGMVALSSAINSTYNQREKRSLLEVRFLAALLAITLGLLFYGGILLLGIIPIVLSVVDFGQTIEGNFGILRWPFLTLMIVAAVGLIFRFCPARAFQRKWFSPGVFLAAILWVLMCVGFSFYVDSFGRYDAMYGSLGSVIIIQLWLYLSVLAILIGAELNDTLAALKNPSSKEAVEHDS